MHCLSTSTNVFIIWRNCWKFCDYLNSPTFTLPWYLWLLAYCFLKGLYYSHTHFHLPDTLVNFWSLIFFNSFNPTAKNWEVCVDSTTLLKNLILKLALVWITGDDVPLSAFCMTNVREWDTLRNIDMDKQVLHPLSSSKACSIYNFLQSNDFRCH